MGEPPDRPVQGDKIIPTLAEDPPCVFPIRKKGADAFNILLMISRSYAGFVVPIPTYPAVPKMLVAFMVVILDLVAITFVVVRLFETAKFVKGWVMFEALMFERVLP